ncbi:hypothetical protein GCM10023149_19820 [Mucilaginibacter gynuensis]|uniref:Lipocalin-like domain-containing protein n=1 Tax=Mucilaginibacter gynuensis TaxID=1302236 RepID=A0ABP8GAZ6_9SPHI
MKKIFQYALAVLAVTFVLSACSTTKNATSSHVARDKFVNTWVLNTVTYEGGLLSNAVQNVFDQAPPSAFVGSVWKLTNSGNGIYTLADGTSQTIFWSVYNGGSTGTQFQFKKIYEGDKAKNVTEGYRLDIGSATGSTLILKSPVPIGTQTGYVVYSFTKK